MILNYSPTVHSLRGVRTPINGQRKRYETFHKVFKPHNLGKSYSEMNEDDVDENDDEKEEGEVLKRRVAGSFGHDFVWQHFFICFH